MSELLEVLRRQRACRAFRPDPVDDRVLGTVLEAATRAPSAENSQPWVFVVVREDERRAAVAAVARRAWEGGARQHSVGRLEPELLADVDRGMTAREGLAGAPVLVVIGADTTRVHPAAVGASIFPAVQNLLLAAADQGLGSVLTTLAVTDAEALRRAVELPETVAPMAVVPLGWPAEARGPSRRRPLREVAHRDVYGHPW